jgi:membrane-associated phospholipid phosphatase
MQVNFRDFLRHFRTLLSDLYSSYRSYIGLILGVVIGLVVCGLLINGFFALLDELTDNELGRFDDAVAMPIHQIRMPWLTDVMLVITWMGDRNAYFIFGTGLFIFFYLRYRSLIFPLQTSVVLLIAGGLNRWLKDLIDRPRPEAQHLVEAGSLSFPSGHAMSSIAFFGFLIYLIWRLISTLWVRWLLSLLLVLLILLIGFSRVYLGVHYPSDILAGYAAGGACLAVFISMFTYVRYRYARKGKEPQVTADEQA